MPELLKMPDPRGAVVTADAMNTRKDIAEQVVKGGGDYPLAVKADHPTLNDSPQLHLDELILEEFEGVNHVYHETTDGGHGRIDTRRVWATDQLDWLKARGDWKKLTAVVAVESTRRMVGAGKVSTERRYFIASLPRTGGERLARLVRNHWTIENGRHWTLDVASDEDQSRVRKDHGDQNLAALRRVALGLLRRDKTVKLGARNKRLKAARNRDDLLKVLLSPVAAK